MDVALFGAGRIGKIHAGNLVRQPGVRLRYVVDVDPAAAGALAQQHGARVVTADEALADKAVGMVVIGSSTDTHADLIMRVGGGRQGDLLREARRPVRGRARARAPTPSSVPAWPASSASSAATIPRSRPRSSASSHGEIGDARDAGRHEPRSGRAAGRVPQALGRHLPRHADPRLRHLPLDPRRRRGHALCDRQRAHRPGRRHGRRHRLHGRDDPHEEGPAVPDQHHAAARPTATTSASR